MLKIGTLIDGKYKILSEIGHGGMSTVYLAINEKANKPWAVKEVRKSVRKDFDILRQSLIVETDLLKRLNHPNLPSIVDVIDSEENFLIVMDYIEGITLDRMLQEHGEASQRDVVYWAMQLCDVLEYLHSRPNPIIYRDMKPSNIMLKSDGDVVLIDFGTAREYKEKNVADTTCLGTQGYAAPEQFGGMGQTDARTDIYCLGATMYHLLTGHNPSQPPYEMYPITHWKPELSSGLEKIVQKCTNKNPQHRYQSASELKYDLENYRDLETQTQKLYKNRMAKFMVSLILAIACAASSVVVNSIAQDKQNSEYEVVIEKAQYTTDSREAQKMYVEAIKINPEQKEAYHLFYDKIIEDGVFDDEEESLLLHLNASTQMYLKQFEQYNLVEYAQFCYEMGNAYWYYYVHEENRQSNAVSWFNTSLKHFENNEEKTLEYKRSRLYVEIGGFYKKIVAAQIDGSDMGLYGEYWNKLCELKSINDENPDRDIVTLRMYKEITGRVIEYARYLHEDGVTKEEISDMLEDIEGKMNTMEISSTSAIKEEIAKIREMMDIARNMIESST